MTVSPRDPLRPLADRMRPRSLDEFVGQQHVLGPGKPLRHAIESGQLHSLILWGPPGTGKTTLARLIAQKADAQFIALSAVMAGVKDIRAAVETARAARESSGRPTLLFLDEVDRKSTRLNSSHSSISYAVFCLKKKSPSRMLSTGTAGRPWRRRATSRPHGRCMPRSSLPDRCSRSSSCCFRRPRRPPAATATHA